MSETSTISSDGQAETGSNGSQTHADRRMLIDGKLIETERTFPSINPATGEVLGYAPDGTIADAQAAVAAARKAFDTSRWATDVELRIHCLEQFHQALVDHREELATLTIAEVGATPALIAGPQLDQPVDIVRYYTDLLKTYPLTEDLGNIESRGMQHHRWVEKEAAGVVAAIIAYNYPNQLALAKLAPALAAGCTVVLKGAPDTPLITLALGELIANHTDIPAGVVNVLSSTDPEVGAVLTTSPDVDMVTFTGSTPTGRRIMAAASETLKRVFLERDKVDGMVKRAVEAGATLVTGGEKKDPGYFYTPTLLTDVDPEGEIAQDEVFGPVLVVIAYDDDDDAVRIANNSIYGLSGAVFGSQDRAIAVARRIRTGTFSINGGNYFSPDSPFGGYKQSGIGREMGAAGLEEFLEGKTFATVVSGAGA
jgi:acyl-CoA reductase-like NAD-dependent aldehyde dehydrogenase